MKLLILQLGDNNIQALLGVEPRRILLSLFALMHCTVVCILRLTLFLAD
jgi:hypothetical protein